MRSEPQIAPGQLIRLLEDPVSYAHRPERVELVQTHASFVAIAPPYVYKVKKALDLGFLDFSTLAKRRHFCEEEVRLNRRLCADAYLGVVPILADTTGDERPTSTGDEQPATSGTERPASSGPERPRTPVDRTSTPASGLRIGAEEEIEDPGVVEYAVHMRYLPSGPFMSDLLAAGSLTDDHLRRVADRLVRFYREHPATPESTAWGAPDRIRISVDENFAQSEAHVGELVSSPALAILRADAERLFRDHASLLERRAADGWVRDCHGDLRLEHVHITPERVCIYDCIEFNERLRYIDVTCDVAFLAMELDLHGRPDLSARFLDLVQSGLEPPAADPDLDRLLTFYKTYRALVRAKVGGMKSRAAEVPPDERAEAARLARRHYRLATHYAVTADRPTVVVVTGRVATGKSTVARALAEAVGWRVLSSDETRKRLAGVPLLERGDTARRERLYSMEATERTYQALLEEMRAELERGRSVVLDATFSKRRHREALSDVLEALTSSRDVASPALRLVELTAPAAVRRERLRDRERGDGVISDARLEDYERIDAGYEPPDPSEEVVLRLEADQDSAATLGRVLDWLVEMRERN